jgi:RNA polymerase sigma-70 factor (ECF subfamily)
MRRAAATIDSVVSGSPRRLAARVGVRCQGAGGKCSRSLTDEHCTKSEQCLTSERPTVKTPFENETVFERRAELVRPFTMSADLDDRFEEHRAELTRFCSAMLGASDAEDAVQETLLRAWRRFDALERRASLRSWLYRIATNVCLDMLQARKRRARPIDLEPVAGGDPAEVVVGREEGRRVVVATLRRLPPRQRAVLILRAIFSWDASEVAELLQTSVASVNSALQRARATLRSNGANATTSSPTADAATTQLIAAYVDAFERYDMDALTSLVRRDAA